MGFKEDLQESHPESVKILEAASFEWVNQDREGNPWPGFVLVKRDGTVVQFSYKDIADHSAHWVRERLAAMGF
jgi:hypothetical protein